jgi:hypothetical protein
MAAKKFLSGIDVTNQRIANLADASAATDAVTLQQLQAYVRGLDWKASVRAASTASLTLAAPGASLDGVSLVSGDRVLLKNQAAASQNGIYVWTGAAVALARAADAAAGTLSSGAAVYVTEGTVAGDTMWVLTTDDPIVVDTTSLAFAQFGGGSPPYTAGNGITISSNVVTVVPASGGGIAVGAGGVAVDRTRVPNIYAADIGNGSSTAITVNHALNTADTVVCLYDKATKAEVEVDVVHTDVNNLTLNFAVAPATAAYRVVVHG